MRTFIAVEVPAPVRDTISRQVDHFKRMNLPVRWVACRNLHITLKFLGEINESTRQEMLPILTESVSHHHPFTMTLKDIGCFPHPRRARVLWIGVERGADEVTEFAQEVEEALTQCGFPREKRFHPHLTIGRVKKPCSVEAILSQETLAEPFRVDALVLFKSTLTPQGAVYEALERFPFGNATSLNAKR